jgi:hypothetical protein
MWFKPWGSNFEHSLQWGNFFFLSEPDMDWWNHQCDMQIQACTYEDHRVYGPGVSVLLFKFLTQTAIGKVLQNYFLKYQIRKYYCKWHRSLFCHADSYMHKWRSKSLYRAGFQLDFIILWSNDITHIDSSGLLSWKALIQ